MNDYTHVTVINLVYLTVSSHLVCNRNPRGFPMPSLLPIIHFIVYIKSNLSEMQMCLKLFNDFPAFLILNMTHTVSIT